MLLIALVIHISTSDVTAPKLFWVFVYF